MKLSFSTKGWHNNSFDEFCDIAVDLGFGGIELHNVNNRLFTDKDGAFHDYAAAATARRLYEKKLQIPCIDVLCDIGYAAKADAAFEEFSKCINIASNLNISFIRVKAEKAVDPETATKSVIAFIEKALPIATDKNITILIETSGLFCKTSDLRNVLDQFACDNLAALWNMSAAFFEGGENAEEIIKNLGAYIKHVHINDAEKTADGVEFCLIGEGELPIGEMMLALRSVNYDGFVSLVWDPSWCAELDDMEIIFSQYVGYMKQYGDTSKNERTFYYNKSHTGKFVWKKDLLIDLTFSEVLTLWLSVFPTSTHLNIQRLITHAHIQNFVTT